MLFVEELCELDEVDVLEELVLLRFLDRPSFVSFEVEETRLERGVLVTLVLEEEDDEDEDEDGEDEGGES